MTDRERLIGCVLGEPVDRPPFYLFWAPWTGTWQNWQRQGMPAELASHADVQKHFGTDVFSRWVPVLLGPCPKFEPLVLAEDWQSITHVDSWGIVHRDLKASESMSEFISFPVRSREDWRKYKAERLDPRHPDRLARPWRETCLQWMEQGVPIAMGGFPDVGVFGTVRWLLGDEECLMAFHDDPALIRDITNHMTDLWLTVFAQVLREVRVDVIHIWEDMCGRNGPLISPAFWEEFLGPCYRRIKQFCRENHIPIITVDTDGQPELILQPMLSAGVNLIFPFEVAAGCDVNDLGRRYPTMGMFGGIDKRALALGPQAIDAELARIRPAVLAGRYIPDLDHLVPSDVTWDNYRYFAESLKRLVYECGTKPSTPRGGFTRPPGKVHYA